jgi:hypothetical protein
VLNKPHRLNALAPQVAFWHVHHPALPLSVEKKKISRNTRQKISTQNPSAVTVSNAFDTPKTDRFAGSKTQRNLSPGMGAGQTQHSAPGRF